MWLDEIRVLGAASCPPKRCIGSRVGVRLHSGGEAASVPKSLIGCAAVACRGLRAGEITVNLGSITRHTMPSNFPAKSLKTKKSATPYPTHFSRVAKLVFARQISLILRPNWHVSVNS
jgi:hypothetical protein